MTAIALILTLIVAAIALLHAYWATGGLWPGSSPADLSNIVVGRPLARTMPSPRLTAVVAAMIAGAAAWPLLLSPLVSRYIAPELAALGTLGLASVFLLRGLAGFTSWMARRHPPSPSPPITANIIRPSASPLARAF